MHEVITASFSPRANNVSTHFYNVQDSFAYLHALSLRKDQGGTVSYDPEVHFHRRLANGMVYNDPRSMMWDFNGGLGGLSKFEDDQIDDSVKIQNLDIATNSDIGQNLRKKKHEYQKALDSGDSTTGLLSSENTEYWTDFSRVLHNPKSIITLNNWEYNKEENFGYLRLHPERKFESYDIGVNEWVNIDGRELSEDVFRALLEDCDLVSGINVITDIDSSWGSLSSEFLKEIRDEYLPKVPCITWGITQNIVNMTEMNLNSQISRIRSMVEILKETSLFIPISQTPTGLPTWVNTNKLWQISAYQSSPLEVVNSLFSETGENSIKMQEFVDGFQNGSSNRKLISSTRAILKDGITDLSCDKLFYNKKVAMNKRNRTAHVFSKAVITRKQDSEEEEIMQEQGVIADFTKLSDDGTPTQNLVHYKSGLQYPSSFVDSFPQEFEPARQVEFENSDKSREMFDQMFQTISVYYRNVDNREELKEDLENMKAEYEWGYYDSDSDYDD